MTDQVIDWRCRVCRRAYAKGQPDNTCSDCQRHVAYGVLLMLFWGRPPAENVLAWLEALAAIMGHVSRLRRTHSREMVDEQRALQRQCGDAYAEGESVGRRSAEQW